jgi:hypothetical protein
MQREKKISDKDFLILQKLYKLCPPPGCFDIRDTRNPNLAEKLWGEMANKGYVKIDDFASVGIEKIKGKFVTITNAGVNALFGSGDKKYDDIIMTRIMTYHINVQGQMIIVIDAYNEDEAKKKAFDAYSGFDTAMEQHSFDQIISITKKPVGCFK